MPGKYGNVGLFVIVIFTRVEFITQGPVALMFDVPKGDVGGGGRAVKADLLTISHTRLPVAGSCLDIIKMKSPAGLVVPTGVTFILPLAVKAVGILGRVVTTQVNRRKEVPR